MKKIALFGFVTVLTISAFHAEPSLAGYICPNGAGPGEVQIGMTTGGNGVADLPVCEQSGGGGGQQPINRGDEHWSSKAWQGALDRGLRDSVEVMLRGYGRGSWIFAAAGGNACKHAKFTSRDGFIEVEADGHRLGVGGLDIPVPPKGKTRQIRVVLETTGNRPVAVTATNGVVAQVLGTLKMSLDTERVFNAESFGIRILQGGKVIFASELSGGLKIRENILQCRQQLAQRR